MAHSIQTEISELKGSRVRITRDYDARLARHRVVVEGKVVGKERVRTESSHVSGRGGRVWIERLVLEKDDGEITKVVLDQTTRIEKIG